MANGKVMDELLYLAVGAAAAELVDVITTKYADPKANLHIAMLKSAGKPSVYIPGAIGAAALGYAAYQGDKFGRLKDEEVAMAGYGIYSLMKTAGKLLAPAPATAPASAVRTITGAPIQSRRTASPLLVGGNIRGTV